MLLPGLRVGRCRAKLAMFAGTWIWLFISCGGSSLCDRVDGVVASLNTKAQVCPNVSAAAAQFMFSKSACLAGLSRCSEKDQRTLSTQMDCLVNAPSCVAGQEAQFLGRLEACQFTGTAVSSACANALQTSH
jgi:hypothetical protein